MKIVAWQLLKQRQRYLITLLQCTKYCLKTAAWEENFVEAFSDTNLEPLGPTCHLSTLWNPLHTHTPNVIWYIDSRQHILICLAGPRLRTCASHNYYSDRDLIDDDRENQNRVEASVKSVTADKRSRPSFACNIIDKQCFFMMILKGMTSQLWNLCLERSGRV